MDEARPFPDVMAEPAAACANCGATLVGGFCHLCGQPAHDFERSVGALLHEAFHDLFHADGRIVHTVPDLIFRPARLTRAYLAGHRYAQTPPLRLFLIAILAFFLAGGVRQYVQPAGAWYRADSPTASVPTLSPGSSPISRSFAAWLNPHLTAAVTHQREFALAVDGWLHQIAVLFLPISTLLLGALFFSRRKTFMFDHAIFSMHSLAFMALLFTLVTLLSLVAPLRGLVVAMFLLAPIHLFVHLRGVYRAGAFGTLARMALLFVFSLAGVALLFLGVLALELNGMGETLR
jgi:hypothetical protein